MRKLQIRGREVPAPYSEDCTAVTSGKFSALLRSIEAPTALVISFPTGCNRVFG
jgi:hypothetical protein